MKPINLAIIRNKQPVALPATYRKVKYNTTPPIPIPIAALFAVSYPEAAAIGFRTSKIIAILNNTAKVEIKNRQTP